MNIKVQLIGKVTVKSACEAKSFDETKEPLTFHAFSDTMKARVFESLLKSENKGKIAISITNEAAKTGEWHEPLCANSIINN